MSLRDITIRAIRFYNGKRNADIRYQISRLLYDVYIKEQNWKFEPNNPSGLRIVRNNQLVDNIDNSAIWIVATKDDQSVVGCCRLVDKELIGGQHEVQLYLPKDSRPWKTIASMHPCVEASRMALSLPYRRSLIGTGIVQQALAYVHSALPSYSVFACTSEPAMQKAYERLGIVCVGEPFRYTKNDPLPVKIYWCSPQIRITAMNRTLHKMNQGN